MRNLYSNAFRLQKRHYTPVIPVGALIVFEGGIIGSGIESAKTKGDVTDHAEYWRSGTP